MIKTKGNLMKKWIKLCFLCVLLLIFMPQLSSCENKNTPDVIHGDDGREIILRVFDGTIQWQYQGDTLWFDLITLDEIMGPKGNDGVSGEDGLPGIGVSDVYINSEGDLMVLLSDGQIVNAGSVLSLIDIYRVIFRIDRFSSVYEFLHVKSGELILEPKIPVNPGYLFEGWFFNQEKIDFPYLFDEDKNIELVAKWTEVPFTYEIHQETVYITGYKSFTGSYAIIPKIIDGYPVVEISENAFKDNTLLQSISIPNTVRYIGYAAFRGCSHLNQVKIEDNSELISIGGYAFQSINSVDLKISFGSNSILEDIGEYAFYDSFLREIILPETLKTIGPYAFGGTNIPYVILPNSVESIGMHAFSNNVSLKHVIASSDSSLKTIGEFAFANNLNMISLFIPETVTEVGSSILMDSPEVVIYTAHHEIPLSFHSLWKEGNSLPIVYNIQNAGQYEEFLYVLNISNQIHILGTTHCSPIRLVIPEEIFGLPVTKILRRAFSSSNFSFIEIADSILEIDDYAFNHTYGLFQIRISENSNLQSIGQFAFSASRIFNIYLPLSVSSIGGNAFFNIFRGITIYTSHVSQPTEFDASWNSSSYPVVWNIKNAGFTDELYYVINEMDEIIVLGADYYTYSLIIPTSILGYDVKSISKGAFYGQSIYHMVIPNSVKEIGADALPSSTSIIYTPFLAKPALWNDSFKFESSIIYFGILSYGIVDGFKYVIPNPTDTLIIGSTKDVIFGIIPNIIESKPVNIIARNAFYRNEWLESVTIPKSVTIIRNQAFMFTKNLRELIFENDAGIETIEYSAFSYSGIKSLVIPASLVHIGNQTFYQNVDMTHISFEENSKLAIIGASAFSQITHVEELIIPKSVTTIQSGAFSMMTSLRSVIFEEDSKLETIGNTVFYQTNLTSIILPKSVKSIGSNAFLLAENLESVIFEEGSTLEAIGSFAFSNLPKLQKIIIPLSVTNIGIHGFSNCPNLIIYVRVYSRPSGWNDVWNHTVKDVVWGYIGN
jgi:hypothetical protein